VTTHGSSTRGYPSGFNLLSATSLVYAASALFMAASAGSFVAASHRDQWTEVLGAVGAAMAVVGTALALGSLLLLVVCTLRFHQGTLPPDSRLGRIASSTEVSAFSACVLLSVGTPIMLYSHVFEVLPIVFLVGDSLVTAGAFAFLLAVMLPAATLASRPGRLTAWIGAGIGVVAVIGVLILSLNGSPSLRTGGGGPSDVPNWLTLGGLPFLYWNLPFGTVAAVSSLILWRAYHYIHAGPTGP